MDRRLRLSDVSLWNPTVGTQLLYLSFYLHANGAMHEFRSEPSDSLSFRQLINLSGRCPLSSLIAVRQFGGLERSWLNGLWSDNEAAPSAIRGGILGKNRAFFWSLQTGEAAETETEACSFVGSWKPFTIMERSLEPIEIRLSDNWSTAVISQTCWSSVKWLVRWSAHEADFGKVALST